MRWYFGLVVETSVRFLNSKNKKMQKQNLILLHGALGSLKSFEHLIPHLSKDFNVIAPDLKWHGKRSQTDSDFSMLDLVADFEYLLQNENIQSAHVFGFSMGGYVALSLALKKPELFKSIMTLGTKLDWRPEQAEKEIKMLDVKKIQEKVPQFAQYLEAIHGKNWIELCQQTVNMMLDLGSNPILTKENISTIELPIRLCLGDQDQMVSLEETTDFYRALSKGELQVLPNCMHPIEKVNNEFLAQSIINFSK